MTTRTLAALAAALVIAAAPAGAQVVDWNDYWGLRENPSTAADAWQLIEGATSSDGMRKVSAYLRNEDHPKAARDAIAHGIADLIVADTAEEGAEVRYFAAAALATAALRRVVGPLAPAFSGEVVHRASYEALERVFEALEPPALCDRGELDMIPYPVGDPNHRPRCERRPRETAWCMAGEALHGPEVSKAMGAKGFSLDAPYDPPEVPGLSADAARWWGRCWDGRHPG